jgi:uncharacterized flavoprotein (TIGR03862 family)
MKIAIIGGGPAGLRAAEIAAGAGAAVTVFEAKASVGRKLLVAGRGGLNLTKAEPENIFAEHYSGAGMPCGFWEKRLAEFDVETLRTWVHEMGVETFVASTKRVYPREMKAAPLLRGWIRRLRDAGVEFAVHHRWMGLELGTPLRLSFDVRGTIKCMETDAVVLALGGASWPETGSDGAWCDLLYRLGVSIAPLVPANCGWEVAWPGSVLARAEGQPIKNIAAFAGGTSARGELLVTRYGLEGGALYALGAAIRAMAEPRLIVDFKPSLSREQLVSKLGKARLHPLIEARRCWKLGEPAMAIVEHFAGANAASPQALAEVVKACPITLRGPRPIAEAISSTGGVRWREVDAELMIKALPGVFVAGEMIDWEAPTGGYLIHGCLATGAHAARGACKWLALTT